MDGCLLLIMQRLENKRAESRNDSFPPIIGPQYSVVTDENMFQY
jgi:hypothetical protein